MQSDPYKKNIIDWQFDAKRSATSIVAKRDGAVVGFNGVMPVQVCVHGEQINAQWSCDFHVAANARREGVGTALKSRLYSEYDLTMALGVSELGEKALLRTGWQKLLGPKRFVRILKANNVRRHIIGALQRVSSTLLGRKTKDGLLTTVSPIDSLPTQVEIDSLCHRVKGGYSACIVRDWQYLSWRYCRSPIGTYSIVSVRQGDRLEAIAIIGQRQQSLSLVDYLGPCDAPQIKNAIIRRLLKFGENTSKIECVTSDKGFATQLMRNGFFRQSRPALAFFVRDRKHRAGLLESSWFLMSGDSDPDIIERAREEFDTAKGQSDALSTSSA